eukprot:Phypoly_transcript_12424.p1 GENE.Phypoly_transcript_12424~~Phypoly_transcript_12424.p1  ORF type:complete len:363 (-),score=42.52 Phypoly_transcript_12424:6-1094(-)
MKNCGKLLRENVNCLPQVYAPNRNLLKISSSVSRNTICQKWPPLIRTSILPKIRTGVSYHRFNPSNCRYYCTSTENQAIKQETEYVQSCEESVDEETREETQFMGWDALHWAAFKGNNQKVSEIIQNRKKNIPENNLQEVFKQDLAGVSPLHLAVERGHADVVETLLAQGCDPNVRDVKQNQRLSALHLAVKKPNINIQIVQSLLKYGANVNQEATDKKTPLFHACKLGRNDLVSLLVQAGAKTDIQDNPKTSGWGAYRVTTPLHSAVSGGFLDVVTTLLENGADPNYNLRDDVGESPLHVAALMGRLPIVEVLLKFRANVNSLDCFGATPVDYAKSNDDVAKDAVRILQEHGGKDGKGRRL